MARGYASSLLILHSTNDSHLLAFEKQLVAGKQTWKNPSHCHQLITWKGIDERFKKEAEKAISRKKEIQKLCIWVHCTSCGICFIDIRKQEWKKYRNTDPKAKMMIEKVVEGICFGIFAFLGMHLLLHSFCCNLQCIWLGDQKSLIVGISLFRQVLSMGFSY